MKLDIMRGLTVERLREVWEYNSETGLFTRRVGGRGRRAGDVACCKDTGGYVQIGVDGREYKAHRHAWLYMTGEWPKDQIDHVNLIPADNRWCNLRAATGSQNKANSKAYRNNTSGFKGVSWHKRDRKWLAQIRINGERRIIGYYDNIREARCMYLIEAAYHFGEFARA